MISTLTGVPSVMFCKHCHHSVDYTRLDTVKDHIKSKKHMKRKESKTEPLGGSSKGPHQRQISLDTAMKSKDLREGFILSVKCFVKCCTMADIPLNKVENMRPFMRPNSVYVPCLAHIINLGAEAFQHYPEFSKVDTFTKMVKSSFFKKPARKNRHLKYVREYLTADQCKLPHVPVSTRWNSWYNCQISFRTPPCL
ncbi:PREDICTED: uncharacterized protein LOC106818770 [Priapulus caudatus]|uniref:Uncharacterized protein LOC106818770 n=1 Tax=Priapulus caudatus TaxID=37621 RepID=A0ABM1F3B0_PRICU|nr:PREDICTED: uncharacterized protein LOC106818770 [Priapulus caudatus]